MSTDLSQKHFQPIDFKAIQSLEDKLIVQVSQQSKEQKRSYDVIVVGVGSMGAAACYFLANQNVKVLGIEQFTITHENGSHSGESRIIRKAYAEHPDYVPLLEGAYSNWTHLENISGNQMYYPTGLLYFGYPNHSFIQGLHASAKQYKIPLKAIPQEDWKKLYPRFDIPGEYQLLYESNAGFLLPNLAILSYTEQALKNGAIIKTGTQVLSWEKEKDHIRVITSDGIYYSQKLIVTAGPWARKLLPQLANKLSVTLQTLAWIQPVNPSQFALGQFPCWACVDDKQSGLFYGFPALDVENPGVFKMAYHYPGVHTDPDGKPLAPSETDHQKLVQFLNKYMPGTYSMTYQLKSCYYTNTPDQHFVLDFLPNQDKKVIIAAGFSGHGFKFASVVGEILCNLAIEGRSRWPIHFLRANRWQT